VDKNFAESFICFYFLLLFPFFIKDEHFGNMTVIFVPVIVIFVPVTVIFVPVPVNAQCHQLTGAPHS